MARRKTRKAVRRPGRPSIQTTDLKQRSLLFLYQQPLSGTELAQRLNVSLATVNRILASLRDQGIKIVPVRDNGSWHYEVRETLSWREMRQDPAMTCVVTPNKKSRPTWKEEDRSIYNWD